MTEFLEKCRGCGRHLRADACSEYRLCTSCLHPPRRGLRKRGPGMVDSIVVLKCPGNAIGRGNSFTREEFRVSLRAGHWPLGMIVQTNEGIKVVCGVGKAYREPADTLPGQWTRRLA